MMGIPFYNRFIDYTQHLLYTFMELIHLYADRKFHRYRNPLLLLQNKNWLIFIFQLFFFLSKNLMKIINCSELEKIFLRFSFPKHFLYNFFSFQFIKLFHFNFFFLLILFSSLVHKLLLDILMAHFAALQYRFVSYN